MSMKIRYTDVALGADKAATVTTTEKTGFSDVSKIPTVVTPPALATCELNGWGLSPEYKARTEQHSIAFWSDNLSGEDCVFSNVPTITLAFSEQYTTTGITIQFAPGSADYCRKIKVTWYQGDVIIEQEELTPTTPVFVRNKTVVAFDKLVCEFKETSLPRKRCKIEGIIIGVRRDFDAKELKSVKSIHEVDLVSATLPINVLDASIHGTDEVDYIFQKKQPVEAYNDNVLIGVYYIDKGERTGRYDFNISCQDVIGLLDLVEYKGGLWLTDTRLTTILNSVFGDLYEFDIDPVYKDAKLKGFIARGKKQREALQHIAFALGAIVDTSGTRKIKLFPPSNGDAKNISEKLTYTGGKIITSDTVTAVDLVSYDIVDKRPVDGEEKIEFEDIEYRVTKKTVRVNNPNTVVSDPENIKKFDGCYLVNSSNVQALAENLMKHYQRRNNHSFKHVLGGQIAGGKYAASLPWGGLSSGNITKMTVTTSNITVSDTEMVLD